VTLRLLACAAVALCVGGCAGVPAAVVWTVAGAGLGYVASVNALGTEILRERAQRPAVSGGPFNE
jgi:hypothetical protein